MGDVNTAAASSGVVDPESLGRSVDSNEGHSNPSSSVPDSSLYLTPAQLQALAQQNGGQGQSRSFGPPRNVRMMEHRPVEISANMNTNTALHVDEEAFELSEYPIEERESRAHGIERQLTLSA